MNTIKMDEIESPVINFERLCRLCLQEKRILMDIFDSTEDNYNLSIHQKIKTCATINLYKGDGLPTRICSSCLSSLNAAFDFRIQCENADKTLHDIHHLLISDQCKKDIPHMMGNDIQESKAESKETQPKQLQHFDFNHIIVIKKEDRGLPQENSNDCVDDSNDGGNINRESNEEHEEKETEDLFYVMSDLKKTKELSDNPTVGELISANGESIVASNSLDALALGDNKIRKPDKIIFPGSSCSQEGVRETQDPLDKKKGITVENKEKAQIKMIADVKKTACPFCNKMLARVNEHVRLLHRNKVYICRKHDCGAKFLTLKNLQSHQLRCYNMEKPYKCTRCFKEFYRKCNYKSHVIRHSNNKDFQCQLCDKAFVDSTGLKRHFLKHHEPQQEIFVSGCCGKKFKTKEGLKQHIQKGICGVQIIQI